MARQSTVGSRQSSVASRRSPGASPRSPVASPRSPVESKPSKARGSQPAVDPGATAKRNPLELDRLIHERLRLGIVSALAVTERLTFNELKDLLRTTDGNLSVHARKLEDAEYISCAKSFEGRLPRTEYRLTAGGRRALEKYLAHMEAIIRAVRT